MSAAGAPDPHEIDAKGLKVAIVAGSWHELAMSGLIQGATARAAAAGAQATVYRVPGAFELPIAAQAAAAAGFDAVVALGVVVQGETPHFHYVSRAVTDGLLRVSLDSGVPVGFGVLTCEDSEQAFERSGLEGAKESKGAEAMDAALVMVGSLKEIKRPQSAQPTGF